MNLTKKIWICIAMLFTALVLISFVVKWLLQIRIDAQMMQEDLEQKDREFEIALDEVAKGKDLDKVEYIPPSGAPKPNVDPLPNES